MENKPHISSCGPVIEGAVEFEQTYQKLVAWSVQMEHVAQHSSEVCKLCK